MAVAVQIWLKTIIEGLFADNSFMSKAVNDDIYVNMGKTVHIPNAGAPSAVSINRTSVPATASKRVDTDVEYSLDELTTDPIYIPNAETVELSYNKRNSVIAQDRLALIEKAAENMLYKWNPAVDNMIGTSGAAAAAHTPSATGNRKALTQEDVMKLMVKFNEQDVPQEGRYLLLDATMYAQLMASLTQADKWTFQQTMDVKRGIMGQLYGFNIMQRSKVLRFKADKSLLKWGETGAATDLAAGLAWQENSLSRALGEVKMFDSSNNPLYYGDIYSFLVRCGGAIRRSDKKGVSGIVQTATT